MVTEDKTTPSEGEEEETTWTLARETADGGRVIINAKTQEGEHETPFRGGEGLDRSTTA